MSRHARLLLAPLLVALACGASSAGEDDLVWYLQGPRGEVNGRAADEPVNPASLIKIATTLWALERLGPERRFATRFGFTGAIDENGVLRGDLVVSGDGDPDFHDENAWLVVRGLRDAGIREVAGDLLVDDGFSFGWENGEPVASGRRARVMAERLRAAFDASRWSDAERGAWGEFVARRGLAADVGPPRLVVRGTAGRLNGDPPRPALIHHSNPLPRLLRRFNAYSNNDIARLSATLGEPADLQAFLHDRLGGDADRIRVTSLSGLGSNRMTPRQVVRLLGALRETTAVHDLTPRDVLPVVGCDPGTLRLLPGLDPALAGRLVGKTGTLVDTDGGVVALAGFVDGADGTHTFCVAAPGAGHRLTGARRDEARWILARMRAAGPAEPDCGPGVPFSDEDARVVLAR